MDTKIVPPTGPKPADLLILGEAPGLREAQLGKPFVGPSGRLQFSDALARAGILRSDCRILNVYWTRPPDNKISRVQNKWAYIDKVTQDILDTNPKLILAVGATALEALTGKTEISKWRGSVLTNQKAVNGTLIPCPILPVLHPANVLRTYKDLV